MKHTAKASLIAATVLLAATGVDAAAQAQPAPARVHPHATVALLGTGYLSTNGSQIVDSTGKRVRIASVALHGNSRLDQTAIVNQDTPLAGLNANLQAISNARARPVSSRPPPGMVAAGTPCRCPTTQWHPPSPAMPRGPYLPGGAWTRMRSTTRSW